MYDLYHKSMDFFLIQPISPYSRVSKHAGGSSHSWPKLTWFEPGSVTVRNRSRRLIGQSLSMMSMAFMWNVHVRGFPFRFHHFFFYCLSSAWAFFFSCQYKCFCHVRQKVSPLHSSSLHRPLGIQFKAGNLFFGLLAIIEDMTTAGSGLNVTFLRYYFLFIHKLNVWIGLNSNRTNRL